MQLDNVFAQATRTKLRFHTSKGVLSIEDLWDLPLIRLDDLARLANKQLQEVSISFIGGVTQDNTVEALQFNIIKTIISVKLQEKAEAELRQTNLERKHKLLSILASKQDAALQDKTEEEILKELESLG
jgi:hypothetical protein